MTSPTAPAQPVPVAFLGRTSTLLLQDPAASLARQYRSVQEKLPPGWFIAAHYWDIESGGMDLEKRGHGDAHQRAQVEVPRDGGMADLLAEAGSPSPRFAAVMCEDIERSARDTFSALKLERELAAAGVPLLATDEPIDVAGMNATTVLVRRVKQGVAEWYRLQIMEKAWKGLREHALAGWNIGTPPYGYQAERVPHPVAFKAAQGRTKTRLALHPDQARVVAQIYAWRTVDKTGLGTITARLNADPHRYPPPDPAVGWTVSGVYGILRNPKYTGHMVFGRRRTVGGKMRQVPREEWLWSPEPTHPVIVDRGVWEAAQEIGAEHGNTRDGTAISSHPQARRTYVLRSRVRCRICQRRMCGVTRTEARYWNPSLPGYSNTYYQCSHDASNPRHVAAAPDHPRTVQVNEKDLLRVISEFFAQRVFGPDRSAHLAAALPASPAEAQAQRQKAAARLHKRIRQIDAAENAHAREVEALASLDPNSPAVVALRSRILARFTELEDERATIGKQLEALAKERISEQATELLDRLPMLGDELDEALPRLAAQLFQAFDLQCLYSKHDHQVTIRAVITPTTPHALAKLIADSETPDAPLPAALSTATGQDTVSDSVRHP